jgi:hypothetical protein
MTNQEITSKLQEKGLTVGITINTEFVKDAIEDVKVFGYKYWESNTAAGSKMKELIKSLTF